ncbi:histidine kinase [Natrinema saccharevitans]|uniref:histidine kinase n=1 Tax=Natrinema saccharevitans TaxID=301967 RepID=A0A1S8AUS6_9EURY|nr:HAMP domain-containing sensor histidine kinase [Natrinema saccharevitans]OLZ40432.1 histidine kinase [Natrinema saccharevitans]
MEVNDLASVLLEHAREKLAVVDAAGTFAYVNEASTAIVGYEPAQLVGDRAIEYVHPDDRTTVLEQLEAVTAETGSSATVRYRHAAADGEWVWLESRFTNPSDESLEGCVVSSRDISEQVSAEQERRDAENRLRTITGTVGDVLWMFDGDWEEVLFVNPAYEEVFGQPVSILEDDPQAFLDVVHPDDVPRVQGSMQRVASGESIELEYRVNPAADYGRWVWVRSEPILEDGDVDRIAGFSRDITDRRRRERQLAVMDNLLRHNLRNDMSVILGNAERIASEASEPARRHAKIIRMQGQDLLESAHKQREIIELLTDRPVPESIDLVPVVADSIDRVRDAYPEATIEASLPDAATVRTVHEVELAVTELLENAVRHSLNGSPELSVAVRIRTDAVDIVIRDDCPPIPEVEFRVLTGDWEMDDIYHTSGLGLWLVHWVVDLSDGHIAFERSEGGNTVVVSLPWVS